ncbi:MAG: ABC transporter substrate-binding protein [Acidimicrobiales bacterium]
MQRITRFRRVLVVAGVASLMLASTVSAGASSISGKYNAADAKLVPSAYKGKTLQVATDATYAPDEYMSSGVMTGFDVELMYAIAKTLGITVKENNVTFETILLGIDDGHYQIGNSSFTDEKSREKQVNFVDYFQAGEAVYAKTSSAVKFTGLKSLCGFSVAVETGTTEQTDAKNTAKICPAGKKLTPLSYPTQTEADLAVSSGHATFGFLDSQVAGYVVSQNKGVFKLVGSAIEVAPYGIATPKTPSGKKLAIAIQAAIKTLIANGTYGAILKQYGVTAGGLSSSQIVLNGAIS